MTGRTFNPKLIVKFQKSPNSRFEKSAIARGMGNFRKITQSFMPFELG